jgi:hypothetical protein
METSYSSAAVTLAETFSLGEWYAPHVEFVAGDV